MSESETGEDEQSLFSDETHRFIEDTGILLEKYGLARVGGRIIGLLLVTPRPLNQEEIAQVLQVSRTSVSANLQYVITRGIVQVATRREPGDRRDYYEIGEGGWIRALLNLTRERAKSVRELARDGAKLVEPQNKAATARLKELTAFYDFALEWIGALEESWHKHRAALEYEDNLAKGEVKR